MKAKKAIRLSIMIVSVFLLFKTELSAQWAIGGNNLTSGSTNKIGSKNCYSLKIVTNTTKQMEFSPACSTTSGVNEIKIWNTPYFDASSVAYMYVPGGGVISTKEGYVAKMGKIPTANTRAICRLGITSYQYSGANLDIVDSPGVDKSIINVEVITSGPVNCYGFKSKAVPTGGYGYGINTEGGKYGIYGKASGSTYSGPEVISGLYGTASGTAGMRAGVYASATGTGASVNYGIYAVVDTTTGPNVAGYFQGSIHHTGSITQVSDLKLKENISPYAGALESIGKLQVRNFDFKKEYSFMNLPKGDQIGLIAQELETVFPGLVENRFQPENINPETNKVSGHELDYKSVNYTGLIPVLIKGMQEQQEKISSIDTKNKELEKEITALKNQLQLLLNQHSEQNTQTVIKESVLYQNKPNPTNGNTAIDYYISPMAKSAAINLYSQSNSLIRSFVITTLEKGQLLLTNAQLSAGIYFYELVVDGMSIDRKQMAIIK